MHKKELGEWRPAQKVLHWLSAAIIIAMAGLGVYMAEFPAKDWEVGVRQYETHKSLGYTVLLLILVRLAVLARYGRPQLQDSSELARRLATFGHIAIYVLLLVQIMIGIARTYVDPLGLEVSLFGYFALPDFLANSKAATESLKLAHEKTGIALGVALLGHVLAAVWHHKVKRDQALRRMWW